MPCNYRDYHPEEWRPVVGFDGYEVSARGQVRRVAYRKGFEARRLRKMQAGQMVLA